MDRKTKKQLKDLAFIGRYRVDRIEAIGPTVVELVKAKVLRPKEARELLGFGQGTKKTARGLKTTLGLEEDSDG